MLAKASSTRRTLLRRAIESDPNVASAYDTTGANHSRKGAFSEAIGLWNKAILLDPLSSEAQTNLAGALLMAGRQADAVLHLREALRIDSTRVPVLTNLAWVLATLSGFRLSETARMPLNLRRRRSSCRRATIRLRWMSWARICGNWPVPRGHRVGSKGNHACQRQAGQTAPDRSGVSAEAVPLGQVVPGKRNKPLCWVTSVS